MDQKDNPPDESTFDTERGDEWLKQTEGLDRVISVALSLEEEETAAWVSSEAHVAENTARKHLSRLVELGVLTSTTKQGVTTYYPDPMYFRFRRVSRAKKKYDRNELEEMLCDYKSKEDKIKEKYDVHRSEDLRNKLTDDDVSAEQAREYRRIASEWDSITYQIGVMQDAIRQQKLESGEVNWAQPIDGQEQRA